MSDAPSTSDRWVIRRRIIFCALAYCAACVPLAVFSDIAPAVKETLITQAFWGAMGIIGAYVFGAVWDDKGR